ncbi:MAG: GTPase Era, partial [Chloroflexaceae bacterium]
MLQCSYDPEAGSLYVYFTELEEGQAVGVLEYPAALLLDAQERIIGLRLDLDDEITLGQLELALDGEYERLDMNTGHLTLRLADEEPARVLPLPETAILDLDGDETVLGVELSLPAELRTPAALERLAPLMLPLEEAPAGGEGPVVFTLPPPEPPAPETPSEGLAAPEAPEEEAPAPVTRSGFVALVGKP